MLEARGPEPHQKIGPKIQTLIIGHGRYLDLVTLVVGPALAAPLNYVVRVACSYEDTGSYTAGVSRAEEAAASLNTHRQATRTT